MVNPRNIQLIAANEIFNVPLGVWPTIRDIVHESIFLEPEDCYIPRKWNWVNDKPSQKSLGFISYGFPQITLVGLKND